MSSTTNPETTSAVMTLREPCQASCRFCPLDRTGFIEARQKESLLTPPRI